MISIILFLGCGDKEIEPSAEPSQEPIPEDTSTTSEPVEEPLCEAIDLPVELPITAEGSTEDGYDFFMSTCSEGDTSGTSDIAFFWKVPTDGIYRIHTFNSGFDTVLTLYDASCDG